MFRPSLAHSQEALHEHSFGGCVLLNYTMMHGQQNIRFEHFLKLQNFSYLTEVLSNANVLFILYSWKAGNDSARTRHPKTLCGSYFAYYRFLKNINYETLNVRVVVNDKLLQLLKKGSYFILDTIASFNEVNLQIWVYIGQSKIFRADAVQIINITTKRMWKLPTSTQLRAIWHTDS
jgi:hypothetical protein